MDRIIYFNSRYSYNFRIKLLCVFFVLCGSICIKAQDYPDEIRGYKVHKSKIFVQNKNEQIDKKDDAEAFVTIGEPTVEDVSLTGVTLEVAAEVSALEQSGKIDFLAFKDFRVNGLKVDVEEYRESFSFKKNESTALPKPVKIFIGIGQTLRGALGELRDSKDEWNVTGTIFVFGRFKKMGFNFKRVVPVEINIKIKNPLKNNN
ncbi:MAG TPA: hypothetical protein VGC76_12115 [Pyrinomonadaceae bacterium]|jgi:hypothetical protein